MREPASESDLDLFNGGASEGELPDDLRAHLFALRRRLPLIVAIAAVCTVIATLRTLNLPAVFSSSTRLQLAKEAPDPTSSKYVMYWEGIQQQYLNTQIKILSSAALAQEVIQRDPQVSKELESGDAHSMIGEFLSGVSAVPVPDTYLVDVTYQSTTKERCPKFANALAEAYISQLESLRGERTRLTERKIAEQADLLFAKLERSEQSLREFLAKDSPLIERHEELLIARIEANNGALATVQRERIRLDAQLEAIQRVLEHGRPLETAPAIGESPIVQSLRSQQAQASLEIATLAERYGRGWHQVRALEARRDQLRLLIQQEIETIRARLQSQRDERTAEEQGLLQRSGQLNEESRDLARRSRTYESLSAEVEANRRFYEEFQNRLKELTHWSQTNVTSARIVDPAVGWVRVGPNNLRNVSLGLMFGLAAGVALALLLERFADRIRTIQEATSALQLPVLGVVPEVKGIDTPHLDLYALTSSRSVYAEAFRRARVQLNAVGAFPSEGCGILLCSSGVPREGKTLCAINLAVASALAGSRTLLVDGDMRNPRVHQAFQFPVSPGLAELLTRPDLLAQAVHATEVPNLFVLTAGTTRDNPAELLARDDAFKRLVAALRPRFDRVVIDTPPVAAVSDGTLMAPAADATLLVVSARTSSKTATMLARTELTRVGAEPCGILFNQQNEREVGYSYYSYYSYYSEPNELPPPEPETIPVQPS